MCVQGQVFAGVRVCACVCVCATCGEVWRSPCGSVGEGWKGGGVEQTEKKRTRTGC